MATIVKKPPQWLETAFPLCYGHIRQLLHRDYFPHSITALAKLQKVRIQGLGARVGKPNAGHVEGPDRLEAALFPRGSLFAVPDGLGGFYRGAMERCPICHALEEREQQLLEEGYGPGSDDESPLLCLGHYAAFKKIHPGPGASYLSARLREELRFLESEPSPLGNSATCPICQGREDAEKDTLSSRIPEWLGPTGPKDLLCLRHLGRVLAMTSGKDREGLLAGQLDRLMGLTKELREFIDMHDYRSPRRPPEGPDCPYRWALRFLTSEPSLAAPFLRAGELKRSTRS